MVWCEHTIVCRQQTINETRLRPTEAEHSNARVRAFQRVADEAGDQMRGKPEGEDDA